MPSAATRVVVRPTRWWRAVHLHELWQYRELLWILILRDVKVRYKQTLLGAAWAVLQPAAAMLVFSLFFGRLANMPSDGLPYPVFACAALLPWQFFSKALTEASTSLAASERIITKIYFPRLLVPTGVVLSGLLDFAIAFGLLIGLMCYYGLTPTVAILAVPGLLLLAVLTALAAGYWLSALDVQYRDVRYTLPFLTQIWMFATPVVYSSTLVPESWRWLYGLNPMVGVVEGFRWSLVAAPPPHPAMLAVSTLTVLTLFTGGVLYFRGMERTLADRI